MSSNLTTIGGELRIRNNELVLGGPTGPCCCDNDCGLPTYFGLEYPDSYGWFDRVNPGGANTSAPILSINPAAGYRIALWDFLHEDSTACDSSSYATGPTGPSDEECDGWNCSRQGGKLICRFYVGTISEIKVQLTATNQESMRDGFDWSSLLLYSPSAVAGLGNADILEDQSSKNCGLDPEPIQINYGAQFYIETFSAKDDPPPRSCEESYGKEKKFCSILWLKPGWYRYEFNTDTKDKRLHKDLKHRFEIIFLRQLDPEVDLSEWAKDQWQIFS